MLIIAILLIVGLSFAAGMRWEAWEQDRESREFFISILGLPHDSTDEQIVKAIEEQGIEVEEKEPP